MTGTQQREVEQLVEKNKQLIVDSDADRARSREEARRARESLRRAQKLIRKASAA